MKILIIGAGRLGRRLAVELSEEAHDLTVIDRDATALARVHDRCDVMTVEGDATQLAILEQASTSAQDMVIAVTDSDQANILACLLSREMGVPRRVARLRATQLVTRTTSVELARLGIDAVINPEAVTVRALHRMVKTPGSTEAADFADSHVVMRAFKVEADSVFSGAALARLRNQPQAPSFIIAAVERDAEIIVPRGDFELAPGDEFYVFLMADTLESFIDCFGLRQQVTRRVVVFGGGRIGRTLCSWLETEVSSVICIEPDATEARLAAEALSHTTVLHGSGAEADLMEQEGALDADYFIATSEDDHANLMAALLARKHNASHILLVTHDPEYVSMLNELDVGVVVNPLILSVGAILRRVRRGNLRSLVKLGEDRAEALQIIVNDSAPAAGKPIAEISMPEGVLLTAVIHNGEAAIPDGETTLQSGDEVVVLALKNVAGEAILLLSGESTGELVDDGSALDSEAT